MKIISRIKNISYPRVSTMSFKKNTVCCAKKPSACLTRITPGSKVRICPFGNMCPYLRFAKHCEMDVHLANKPAEAEMNFIAELEAGQRPCKRAPNCPRADCIFCIVMKKLAAEKPVEEKPVEKSTVENKCTGCTNWGCEDCNGI